jgi:hypothetical protein
MFVCCLFVVFVGCDFRNTASSFSMLQRSKKEAPHT